MSQNKTILWQLIRSEPQGLAVYVDDSYKELKHPLQGVGPIVPFQRQSSHSTEDGEHGLSHLSGDDSWLYRGRLLVLLVSAAGLWIALFAVAKLFFH